MELEYGELVEDKDNKVLGTIDHIILDTWTGEQRKYVVRRDAPKMDIFFSPEHVENTTKKKVKLNISLDDLVNE